MKYFCIFFFLEKSDFSAFVDLVEKFQPCYLRSEL